MEWYRTTRAVLAAEPETWLAYLKGQCFGELQHLQNAKPRFRGALPRLLVFFYFVFRRTGLTSGGARYPVRRVLVYAGTDNQKAALGRTIDALRERGASCLALAEKRWIRTPDDQGRYLPVALSPLDVVRTAMLVGIRIAYIRRELNCKSRLLWPRHLDTFCEAISNLVYFEQVLRRVQPSVILVSNDHSPANRALIALSRHREIRIAYLQHASVSSLFPALDVDYAFLDGAAALAVYKSCERNYPPGKLPREPRYVFLSGQKKPVARQEKVQRDAIGIALNKTDRPDRIEVLARSLSDAGFRIRLRWHPGMGQREKAPVEEVLSGLAGIRVSDPAEEDMPGFLAALNALIAGDSSVHLEAALAGVVPVYHEMADGASTDYYGYARAGVSRVATTPDEALDLVRDAAAGRIAVNAEAVRHYSATFGSCREGREGELVAETLIALERGAAPETLWGFAGTMGDDTNGARACGEFDRR